MPERRIVFRCPVHGLVEQIEETPYYDWETGETTHKAECPIHVGIEDVCLMEVDGPVTVEEVAGDE